MQTVPFPDLSVQKSWLDFYGSFIGFPSCPQPVTGLAEALHVSEEEFSICHARRLAVWSGLWTID